MESASFFIIIILVLFFCLCTDNQPGSEIITYDKPSYTIVNSDINMQTNDSVAVDTITIIVKGNNRDSRNFFRWALDDNPLPNWANAGNETYTIKVTNITEGIHTLQIDFCYDSSGEIDHVTYSFFKVISTECMKFRVLYDGNGNTGGAALEDTMRYGLGDTVIIASIGDDLVKTGCTFAGWNTKPDGSGVMFSADTKITMGSETLKLYAMWYFPYKVTFDPQNADSDPVPLNKTIEATSMTVGSLPSPPLKRTCTFAGWYTEKLGGGTQFTEATPVTFDITVYARWTVSDIEGHQYTTNTFGTQVWMIENLNTTKYNDGSSIPLLVNKSEWFDCYTKETPGCCWYHNDSATNGTVYGALYNWYVVNTGKLAPPGWHVPSNDDWKKLQEFLIDNGFNYDKITFSNHIAKAMASKTEWEKATGEGVIGNDLSKNNASGFSGLPAGYRLYDGTFYYLGSSTGWWSSTPDTINAAAISRTLSSDSYLLYPGETYNAVGYSVRCIRD